jgi:hypothetical protein
MLLFQGRHAAAVGAEALVDFGSPFVPDLGAFGQFLTSLPRLPGEHLAGLEVPFTLAEMETLLSRWLLVMPLALVGYHMNFTRPPCLPHICLSPLSLSLHLSSYVSPLCLFTDLFVTSSLYFPICLFLSISLMPIRLWLSSLSFPLCFSSLSPPLCLFPPISRMSLTFVSSPLSLPHVSSPLSLPLCLFSSVSSPLSLPLCLFLQI